MHKLIPVLILVVLLGGIFYVVNGYSFAMDFSSSDASSGAVRSYFTYPFSTTSVQANKQLVIKWRHRDYSWANRWSSRPLDLTLYKGQGGNCQTAEDNVQICGSPVAEIASKAKGYRYGGYYRWTIPSDVAGGDDYTVVATFVDDTNVENTRVYKFQTQAFKIVNNTMTDRNAATLSKASPAKGTVGTVIKLQGEKLSGATSVDFYQNGQKKGTLSGTQYFLSNTATSVEFILPKTFVEVIGADRYQILAVTPNGNSNTVNFDIYLNASQSSTDPEPTAKKMPPWASLGDVDGDGYVTEADAELVLNYAAGSAQLSNDQMLRADVNGNHQVTGLDASYIRQYVAGVITKFP